MSAKSSKNQNSWKPKGHRHLNETGRARIQERERLLKAQASQRRKKARQADTLESAPVAEEVST